LDWRTLSHARQNFPQVTRQIRAANITVLNSPAVLPDSFLQQNWETTSQAALLPPCLKAHAKCEAILTDLDGDGTPEILLFPAPTGAAAAFKLTADGSWAFLGSIANANCRGVRDALRAGKFETVAPLLKDIEANGRRLRVNSECAPPNQ
jgi:hypothetical protein